MPALLVFSVVVAAALATIATFTVLNQKAADERRVRVSGNSRAPHRRD